MSKIIFSKNTDEEEKPSFEFTDPKSELREVMKRYDRQTYLIISVLMVSFIILIIMVGTLIMDSLHFNSAIYTEYSNKIELQNQASTTNSILLNQIQQNQIELQNNQKLIQSLRK